MRAELVLRVAADLNAAQSLTTGELCTLLEEDTLPVWVFEEAARRTHDDQVAPHLFSHPKADSSLLERAVGTNTGLLDRLDHHVNVYTGAPVSLSYAFGNLVPEVLSTHIDDVRLAGLLRAHLPPLCSACLAAILGDTEANYIAVLQSEPSEETSTLLETSPTKLDLPRRYAPLARFVLLGDFSTTSPASPSRHRASYR